MKTTSSSLFAALKAFGLRRLLLWFVISLPAAWSFGSIVFDAIRRDARIQDTNLKLREQWPKYRAENRWPESELVGNRLMRAGKVTVNEEMAYFDTLIALGERMRALGFLEGRERAKSSGDLPSFRYRYAEKLLQSGPSDPVLVNQAILLLRQALSGGLPTTEEFATRRLLGSQAYASSDYDLAIEMLKPLETESVDVAVEIAWIRWIREIDGDTTEARAEAKKVLDELLRQASQRKKLRLVPPSPRELSDISMLLVILGREAEFPDVTRDLVVLSAEEKDSIKAGIDDYRLNAELKKRRPDFAVVAPILLSRIEQNPNDVNARNQAIAIWASLPSDRENPFSNWVRQRIESPDTDAAILHFAADRCRESGKWAIARDIYSRILEKSPDDYIALNNLAECCYKSKPFDFEQGLKLVDRAAALAPANPAVAETRGQLLARLGKLDESKSILEECLAIYQEDWNLRNTLAQIYERKGESEKAESHRRIMSRLKPPPGSAEFETLP